LRGADLEGFFASLEMTARIESTALTFVGTASSRDEVLMPSSDAHQRNLRKGRFSQCGYWYLITTGTKGRLPMLSDPAASRIVMDCLKWLEKQGRMDLTAGVIMPDHIHFVARLLSTTLPSLMHSLKSFTSNKINEELGREGPLWEPQYHDHAIRTDDELKERVIYCLHNPVRKGLVNHFKDYPHWYCAYEA
jgi:REP element-mobilizing transposase RayT